MVSSILMLLSQCNGNVKLKNACAFIWMFHLLFKSNFQLTLFTTINLAIFLLITLSVRKIRNERLNLCGATASILAYSLAVDVVCYYIYPQFVFDQNLLEYAWNGILFNSKYVLSNGLALFLYKFSAPLAQNFFSYVHGLLSVTRVVVRPNFLSVIRR